MMLNRGYNTSFLSISSLQTATSNEIPVITCPPNFPRGFARRYIPVPVEIRAHALTSSVEAGRQGPASIPVTGGFTAATKEVYKIYEWFTEESHGVVNEHRKVL